MPNYNDSFEKRLRDSGIHRAGVGVVWQSGPTYSNDAGIGEEYIEGRKKIVNGLISRDTTMAIDVDTAGSPFIHHITNGNTINSPQLQSNVLHMQRMNALRTNGGKALYTSLDIEALGVQGNDNFVISEIGLRTEVFQGRGKSAAFEAYSQKGLQSDISIMGNINKVQEDYYRGLIGKVAENGGIGLTQDEYRSLSDLLKYTDGTWGTATIYGQKVNTFEALNAEANMVQKGSSLSGRVSHLTKALNNLVEHSNKSHQLINILSAHLEKAQSIVDSSKGAFAYHGLAGQNLLVYDLPAVLGFAGSATNPTGGAAFKGSRLVEQIRGLALNNYIFDMMQGLRTITSDPVGFIMKQAAGQPNSDANLAMYMLQRSGLTKQEDQALAYGIKTASHFAHADATAMLRIANVNINGMLDIVQHNMLTSLNTNVTRLLGSDFMYINMPDATLQTGDRFVAHKGLKANPLDSHYRITPQGGLVDVGPRYGDKYFSTSALNKNMEYEFLGIVQHKQGVIPSHTYGSLSLVLRNVEEDIVSVITRPEDVFGKGIEELYSIIQNNMVPRGIVSAQNYASGVRLNLLDRSRRGYDRIWEDYDTAKRIYGVVNQNDITGLSNKTASELQAIWNSRPDLQKEFKSFNEFRNTVYSHGRLSREGFQMSRFFDFVDQATAGYEDKEGRSVRNASLISLRNIFEGKTPIEGFTATNGKISPGTEFAAANQYMQQILKIGAGQSWDLNITTKDTLISSLQTNLKNNRVKTLNSLRAAGLITTQRCNELYNAALSPRIMANMLGTELSITHIQAEHALSMLSASTPGGANIDDALLAFVAPEKDSTQLNCVRNMADMVVKAPPRVMRSATGQAYRVGQLALAANESLADNIFNRAISEGRARGVFGVTGTGKNKVVTHNAEIIQQLQRTSVLLNGQVSGVTKGSITVAEDLNSMVTKLLGLYNDSNMSSSLIRDYHANSYKLAVYGKQFNLPGSASEILNNPNVALIDLPFLNEDFTFNVGQRTRINRMYLVDQQNGRFGVTTGLHKLIGAHANEKQAYKISGLIRDGHIQEARKIVARTTNNILDELSGVGKYDIYDLWDERSVREAAPFVNKYRAGLLNYEGSIEGLMSYTQQKLLGMNNEHAHLYPKLNEFFQDVKKLEHTSNFMPSERVKVAKWMNELMPHLGIDGNMGSQKENQAAKYLAIATINYRNMVPMGFLNSMANASRTMGSFNVMQLDPDHFGKGGAEVLNPYLVTEGSMSEFYTGDKVHRLNLKTAYMNDRQIMEAAIAANQGKVNSLHLRVLPSTTEGLIIMDEKAASLFTVMDKRTFTVDELGDGIRKGLMIDKKTVIGRRLTQSLTAESDSHLSDRKVTQVFDWDKTEQGHIVDVFENGDGTKTVEIQYEKTAKNGMKIVDESGGRNTVLIANLERDFGLKGVQVIANTRASTVKHRIWATEVNSVIRNMLGDIDKLTVGNTQRAAIEQSINKHMSNYLNTSVDFTNTVIAGNNFRVAKVSTQTNAATGLKVYHLSSLEDAIGNISKDVSGIVGRDVNFESSRYLALAGVNSKIQLGHELYGRQPVDDWYKTEGIDAETGRVKLGSRHIEAMDEWGNLKATKAFYENELRESAVRDHPEIGRVGMVGRAAAYDVEVGGQKISAMGKVGMYYHAGMRIDSGYDYAAHAGDTVIRVTDLGVGGADVSFNALKGVPDYVKGQAQTMDSYRGTWFDMAGNATNGRISTEAAANIYQRGGAWLELPADVQLNGKTMNKIWLVHGSAVPIKGTDQAVLNGVDGNVASILRNIQNIRDAYSGNNSTGLTIGEMTKSLTSSIERYNQAMLEQFGKDGFLKDKVLKGKMVASGQYQIQTLNMFQNEYASMVGGEMAEHGVAYVHEDYFREMFKGHEAEQALVQRAKDEGLMMMVGREPVFNRVAFSPLKVVVNNELAAGNPKVMHMTLGTAAMLKADSDGDNIFVVGTHWKGVSIDKHGNVVMGQGKHVIDEMTQFWTQHNSMYSEYYTKAQEMFEKEYGHTTSSLREFNEWAYSNQKRIIDYTQLPAADYEGIYARYGRDLIGQFSNMNSGYRRLGMWAKNNMGEFFTDVDQRNISDILSLFEQKGISSKKTDVTGILDEITSPDLAMQQEGWKKLHKYGAANSELFGAVKSMNREGILNASRTLGLIEDEDLFGRQLDSLEKLAKATRIKYNATPLALGNTRIDAWSELANTLTGTHYDTREIQILRELTGENLSEGTLLDKVVQARFMDESRIVSDATSSIIQQGSSGPGTYTVGDYSLDKIRQSTANFSKTRAGVGVAAAFVGINLIGGLIGGPNGKDIPSDEKAGYATGYVTTPTSSPPAPTARVTPNDGYMSASINVRARNNGDALYASQVTDMITDAIGSKVNLNVNTDDNSNRLDWQWTQGVVQNAMNRGIAF